MNSAYELIDKLFMVKTMSVSNNLISQATTSVQKVMNANPSRLAFMLVNLGTGIVYILNSPSVSSSKSFLCTASGGGKAFTILEDFSIVNDDWYILASATSNILCLEILISA